MDGINGHIPEVELTSTLYLILGTCTFAKVHANTPGGPRLIPRSHCLIPPTAAFLWASLRQPRPPVGSADLPYKLPCIPPCARSPARSPRCDWRRPAARQLVLWKLCLSASQAMARSSDTLDALAEGSAPSLPASHPRPPAADHPP